MSRLSSRSIELLIDLAEIKLGNLEIADREDRQTQRILERAVAELKVMANMPVVRPEPARLPAATAQAA